MRCGHTYRVVTPVLVRFSKKQIEAIDLLVAEGVGESRSEVICRAVESLDEAICQMRAKLEIEQSNRDQSQHGPTEIRAMAAEIALEGPDRWVWTEGGRCVPELEAEEQGIPVGKCPPRPNLDRNEATLRIRTKFSKQQHEAIDRLVAEEVGVTRPEAIRRAVERLDKVVRRSRGNEECAESYRQQPETEAEIAAGFAAARALVQAEPWVWTEDNELIPKDVAIEQGIPLGAGPPRSRPDWGDHWPGE